MNLVRRLLSAAVLLAVLAAALWLGGVPLDAVLGVFTAAALWEYRGLATRLGAAPLDPVLFGLGLWLLYRALLPGDVPALEWGLGAAAVAGLLLAVAVEQPQFTRWASALAGAVWIGYCLGFYLDLLRWHPGDEHFGLRLVVVVLGGAFVGDTAAYFGGSALGRHRLAPRLSPKKSVEGAVFGLAGTVLWTVAAAAWLVGLPWYDGVLLGGVVGVAEQGGDLVESSLKRAAGVKDSSALIPGHGGLLDRMDALLLIAPAAYAVLRVIRLA